MPLSPEEVARRAPAGWMIEGGALRKPFTFKGFTAAVAFVQRMVGPANEARHHPDLEIHYDHVVVSLMTHEEGGITDEDLRLAAVIDGLADTPTDP